MTTPFILRVMKESRRARLLMIYNGIYLGVMAAWTLAWWFFGFRAYTNAHFSPGFAVFIQFAWMPFGVLQVYLVQRAMKADAEQFGKVALTINAMMEKEVAEMRARVLEHHGIDASEDRLTIQ